MKRLPIFCLISVVLVSTVVGQDDDVNVISYYAVGNSLDGQLMIDMVNVLRFYPVFAMRKGIDSVRVTIYYGSYVYNRNADKMDGGQYWEVLLPKFKLGEAIQRMEVEVHFEFEEQLRSKYRYIQSLTNKIKRMNAELLKLNLTLRIQLQQVEQQFDEEKRVEFRNSMEESNRLLKELGIDSKYADALRKKFQEGNLPYTQYRDSLLKTLRIPLESVETLDLFVSDRLDLLQKYSSSYHSYRETRQNLQATKDSIQTKRDEDQQSLFLLLDSAKISLAREIEVGLTDTLYSGPSVRKSDIVVDPTFDGAHILYRNYKTSLRFMPALDPAERMGIFRIRYIPFPIVGTSSRPRMHLRPPMSSSSPTVFEIGIAFGDAIVPGDDFVVPEFSWRRLGVAFAIAERMFSDSAEVIGLALTYDFNSYGSIGLGGNFAGSVVHGYASFGINKKAFEAVLGALASLIK